MRGLPDAAYLTSRAEEIVTSTNYSTMYSTQFIFTSVEFECSGAITGWTTLARDGTARGRPEISIWTPDGSGYTKYICIEFTLMKNMLAALACFLCVELHGHSAEGAAS